ncbi:MAG: hypothetical protein JWO68_4273 [Actinomycetia bacterium]|nr:hypothetical protein [Actinomycetes bacterium]
MPCNGSERVVMTGSVSGSPVTAISNRAGALGEWTRRSNSTCVNPSTLQLNGLHSCMFESWIQVNL